MSRRAPPARQEKDVEATSTRQVRRRLTTSRRSRSTAFRERLVELDMAEARREIAAALRLHRASSAVSRNGVPRVVVDGHHEELRRLPRLQPQTMLPQQWAPSPPPSICCDGGSNAFCSVSDHSLLPHLAPAPVALPAGGGGLDLDLEYHLGSGGLPARPLGLNLSLHGLIAAGASVYDNEDGKRSMGDGGFDRPCPLIQPPPPPCDSKAISSPLPASMLSEAGLPAMASVDLPAAHANPAASLTGTGVDWGDGAVADTAAWWWSVEDGCGGELDAPAADGQQDGGGAIAVADAGWLQYDGSGDQQGVTIAGTGTPPDGGQLETCRLDGGMGCDYYCWSPQREGDAQDITFPCMEIGEIEGWDGEWFA